MSVANPDLSTTNSSMDRAVESMASFWQWWDVEPDSDMMLGVRNATESARRHALDVLPDQLKNDIAVTILVDGTRAVTSKFYGSPQSGEAYFNEALFTLSQVNTIGARADLRSGIAADMGSREVHQESAGSIVELAALVIRYS